MKVSSLSNPPITIRTWSSQVSLSISSFRSSASRNPSFPEYSPVTSTHPSSIIPGIQSSFVSLFSVILGSSTRSTIFLVFLQILHIFNRFHQCLVASIEPSYNSFLCQLHVPPIDPSSYSVSKRCSPVSVPLVPLEVKLFAVSSLSPMASLVINPQSSSSVLVEFPPSRFSTLLKSVPFLLRLESSRHDYLSNAFQRLLYHRFSAVPVSASSNESSQVDLAALSVYPLCLLLSWTCLCLCQFLPSAFQ